MSIERLLKRVYDLPSIPKVVQDLIASLSSRSGAASKVSEHIQSDPAIAAKVLRLANSARYGAGRSIASIDSAVVLLGFDTLKTLIIASGVTTAMAQIPGLDMRQFWRESFIVAQLAKTLALCAKEVDKETAFTCGLLHKIGTALMYLGHKERMQTIALSLAPDEDPRQKQRNAFGYACDEVASRLAEIWRFPPVCR